MRRLFAAVGLVIVSGFAVADDELVPVTTDRDAEVAPLPLLPEGHAATGPLPATDTLGRAVIDENGKRLEYRGTSASFATGIDVVPQHETPPGSPAVPDPTDAANGHHLREGFG